MDVYWFLFNPLVRDLLNLGFGILLVVGVGMLILNLVMLVFSYRRTGPILGIIVSLLIIGISVRWDWFVLAISEVMDGVVQYLGYYLHILIYQWLAQHTPTIITPLIIINEVTTPRIWKTVPFLI